MEKEELDRICANCNDFFPDTMDLPTEMGICLNDEEFDPFIPEIMQGNYACCQKLVDSKKFSGDRDVCADYSAIDMSNCIEIDENSKFGREFIASVKSGPLDEKKLTELLIKAQLENLDFSILPVEKYAKQLHSSIESERNSAIMTLGSLIRHENEASFQVLFEFYQQIPVPKTIEEVHFKKDILTQLNQPKYRESLVPCIVSDLYNTPSNNTTKQFVSSLFQVLERAPLKVVREPIKKMLKHKRFSYRRKQKIKEILAL